MEHISTTYGGKAVGISFNPSGDEVVESVKTDFAHLINVMYNRREETESSEQKRLYSVAITELQTAQMWAVKAITWKD